MDFSLSATTGALLCTLSGKSIFMIFTEPNATRIILKLLLQYEENSKSHSISRQYIYKLVHYCTLSMTECRVGTPYMRRNFIDGPPKASVDQSGPSFLQKLHLGYVPEPQFFLGEPFHISLAPK